MDKTKYLSVCIPTYDMGGVGHTFLKQSLEVLTKQTFKDFDVVISDYSTTNRIKDLCEEYRGMLDIRYYKNTDPTGGMSANANNAIRHATGQLIKILFQDDFLFDESALQQTVNHFDLENDRWLVTACEHTRDGTTFFRPHYPRFNKNVNLGNNTIGSPSVMTIKNDHPLNFDVKLKWMTDCDYYKRCYDAFGKPKIVNAITAVIRIGEHQITNTEASADVRKSELEYMLKKFPKKPSGKLKLNNVTVVAVTGIDPTGAIRALELSMEGIDFYESVLVAHDRPANLPKGITFKQCQPNDLQSKDKKNTNDYSKFIAYRLHEYIDSDFALIVHNDAYVLRPNKWIETFLHYDYIGAPWPKNTHFTPEGVNVRVGNGGFSLRSKKMLNALNVLQLPFTDNGTGFFHEDGVICVYHRKKLEEYGMKFAPIDIAARFSYEKDCDETQSASFGFHNNKKAIPKFFFAKYFLNNILKKNKIGSI